MKKSQDGSEQTVPSESSGSVSKTWRVKRWILEECYIEAPTRKEALDVLNSEGCNGDSTVTKQTCVLAK